MLLGEGVNRDVSKLEIDLTSDAMFINTKAKPPCICRKRGGQMFYNNSYIFFPRMSPRYELRHQEGSELAKRVGSQGPGYRWSFVYHLPFPESPRR